MPLTDPMQRRARFLAQLLMVLIILVSITLVVLFFPGMHEDQNLSVYAILISMLLVILLVAYAANRREHYFLSAGLALACSIIGPWGSLLFDDTISKGNFLPLVYTVISVNISSMLLPVSVTITIASLQFVLLFFLPGLFSFTASESWTSFLAFYVFACVLSIITNILRQRDMDQIQAQIVQISQSEACLYEQSIHDPLTGLYNRRYLQETLMREIHRSMRSQSTMGIILIDLDHFKEVNDTYGHASGDKLLHELGTCLKASIRKSDIACRYGGDEFVLVLPDSSLEDTLERAEDVRKMALGIELSMDGNLIHGVSASSGVSIYPQHGSTGDELLINADDALYRAKSAGRNRVVLAGNDRKQ